MNSEHRGAHILIVDDDALTRNTTRAFLDKHGYAVTAVDSAEAAFTLLNDDYLPDLLLLDVIMPGIDGFETCRMLRHQPKYSHLPVIMLTALDDRESIDQAYRCGATDFITKPLNYPLLRHRMQYMLRSAAVLRHLYESQEALVNTQHIALLGNWTMDAAGDIVAASRQYLDIIGAATRRSPKTGCSSAFTAKTASCWPPAAASWRPAAPTGSTTGFRRSAGTTSGCTCTNAAFRSSTCAATTRAPTDSPRTSPNASPRRSASATSRGTTA